MNQIFTEISESVTDQTAIYLTTLVDEEAIGSSEVINSEMGFVQAQISLIDPLQFKVFVLALLFFAIFLVCRKIVSLDQSLVHARSNH